MVGIAGRVEFFRRRPGGPQGSNLAPARRYGYFLCRSRGSFSFSCLWCGKGLGCTCGFCFSFSFNFSLLFGFLKFCVFKFCVFKFGIGTAFL